LDRVEAGLIAQMESGSAKKERHRRRHSHEHEEEQSQSYVGVYNEHAEHESDFFKTKKRKMKHRDSTQPTSSQDIDIDADGMSADLDAPQRYIPTPRKEKAWELENLNVRDSPGMQTVRRGHLIAEYMPETAEKKHNRKFFSDQPEKSSEGSGVVLNANTREFQEDRKKEQKSTKPYLQEHRRTQIVEEERVPEDDNKQDDDEEARHKEAKRLRKQEKRAARRSMNVSKTNLEDGDQAPNEEQTVMETPEKKRKFDKKSSERDLEWTHVEEEPRDDDAQETRKSTPKEKKRKIDSSAGSIPIEFNYIQVHNAKSSPALIKASPEVRIEEELAEITSKNEKKRKHSNAIRGYESPSTPDQAQFYLENNDTDVASEKKIKKKKKGKALRDSVSKSFLVPVHLLTLHRFRVRSCRLS
jgi:hypothetical protein